MFFSELFFHELNIARLQRFLKEYDNDFTCLLPVYNFTNSLDILTKKPNRNKKTARGGFFAIL